MLINKTNNRSKDVCASMFLRALFTAAKDRIQPKYPTMHEGTKILRCASANHSGTFYIKEEE